MGARHIRGREKIQIMEHIADGQMTLNEIAAKFNRNESALRDWASQHSIEIDALRAENADALKHMWITRKELRLAEAEDDYERMTGWLDDLEEAINHKAEKDEKEAPPREARSLALDTAQKIVKQRQALRREAAEECGGLMNRQPNAGPPPPAVQITIEKE